MRRWFGVPALLIVLVAFAAGCGDDDDSGGGDVLSKQQWIAAADGICLELNDRLDEIPEPQTLEMVASTGAEVNELTRDAIVQLRALVPSAEDENEVVELLDAFDALVDAGEDLTQAAAVGEWVNESEPPEELFLAMHETADTADQLEAAYGLQVCLLSPQ